MRVYFDTNVYRHETECDKSREVRTALRELHAILVASSDNLFETYAIANPAIRIREIRTLTNVAGKFESHPESWRQASELLRSIRRHRRHWLRPLSFMKASKALLVANQRNWLDACAGNLPDSGAYANYRRDYETGVACATQFQKQLRQDHLAKAAQRFLVRFDGQPFAKLDLSHPDAPDFDPRRAAGWHLANLAVYSAARIKAVLNFNDKRRWPGGAKHQMEFCFRAGKSNIKKPA